MSSSDVDIWVHKVKIMKRINYCFFIFEGIALCAASLVLFYYLCKGRNREKDKIYLLIVGFMFLYGVFITPLSAVFLLNELQPHVWLQVFLFFAFYTNFMVHWLFPMQFLQTGIIIKRLYKER